MNKLFPALIRCPKESHRMRWWIERFSVTSRDTRTISVNFHWRLSTPSRENGTAVRLSDTVMNGAVSLKVDLQGLDTAFNGRLVCLQKSLEIYVFLPRPSQSSYSFSHRKLNDHHPNLVWPPSQMLYLPFPEEIMKIRIIINSGWPNAWTGPDFFRVTLYYPLLRSQPEPSILL